MYDGIACDERWSPEGSKAQDGRNCDDDDTEDRQEITDALADEVSNDLHDHGPASVVLDGNHEEENADDRRKEESRERSLFLCLFHAVVSLVVL